MSTSKNTMIVLLAVAFAGSLGYALISNNNKEEVIEQNHTQIATIGDQKSIIQKSFDESLVRLDSMSGVSAAMKSKLTGENHEIANKKAEIRRILNKKDATAAELAKAQEL